jgi:hypothetical protein
MIYKVEKLVCSDFDIFRKQTIKLITVVILLYTVITITPDLQVQVPVFESQIGAWISTPFLCVFLLYCVKASLSTAEIYKMSKRDSQFQILILTLNGS